DHARLDVKADVTAVSADDQGLDAKQKAGIGAVLGSVLGGILGGGRGAVIGAVIAGGGAVVGTKGSEVDLPTGTIVTIRLRRPLDIPAGANDPPKRDARDKDRERKDD